MRLPDQRALAVFAAALVLAGVRGPAAAADASPAPAASAAPAATVQACASSDLALREASVMAGALPQAVYALRNRGAAPCRISGGVGIRLFDAQGKPIPLRFGPRSAMPMLLTLAPGDEASFSVAYGRPGTAQCATSARIDVYFPPQTTPLSAATSFVACAFPAIRVSNLQLLAPSSVPVPSPRPSAAVLAPLDEARFT